MADCTICITDYSFVVTAASGKDSSAPRSYLNLVYLVAGQQQATKLELSTEEYSRFLEMTTGPNDFYYSNKYEDDEYEYRHVHVTKDVAKMIPKNRLMSETEWRSMGIQQSPGWVHYMIHGPERHVLLFRRPLTKQAAPIANAKGAGNTKMSVRGC